MGNKIFFKVGIIVVVIVLIYILFITFFISPKITNYLIDAETTQAKTQLDRVSAIINSKEKSLKDFKKLKVKEYKKNIQNISKIAYNIIENNYQLFLKNKITKEEAIESSIKAISRISYGFEDDYIFILNKKGDMVYHPDKRFIGKNRFDFPDAKGNLVIKKLIENTLKDGSSYTKYFWNKLNSDVISEKIVFSIYFEPFDLIVSSGVYVKNIKEELEREKEIFLDTLSPLINSIILGDRGYIFIMNNENVMLLHPNKKLMNKDVSNFKQPNSNTFMVEDLKDAYTKKQPWKYLWNTASDKKNFIYEKISWINYNEFFGWYIVSSIYEEDLKVKANKINEMTLNVSVLLLLVLLTIAILIIKKLLKPISILSKNAKLIKKGRFDIRNNIQTNDEIGVLARQFDKMLDHIEDNIKNLEQKVEIRTSAIKHQLYYDELTGLKNRISLNHDLDSKEFFALNLIDIDEFNSINELYGFEVGNEVLIKVSEILKEFARQNDVAIYKLSSDVFAMVDKNIMNFTSYDTFLEKIQDLFRNKEIYIDKLEIEIFVYVTIGTSISQNEALKTANIALKRAKKNGSKYLVYNQEIDTKAAIEKTMYWRERIKDAIENDKYVPFYQPIFNQEEKIVKYETLMRLEEIVDGEKKYISPGAFLDIAIKTKQYFKLNEVVIAKSLKNLENTQKSISFNISFADILNIEFVENLDKNIKKLTKEQRSRAVFEILESDFISDYKILDEFILKYRKKGIKIAIDDFGTGYSNFSHILKIKPDYIKIDGSLIKSIDEDINSYEIVKSIIDFSHSLGIKVIAEFIHNQKIYEIVKELGVDEFQGFYLGEPEPLIE